MSGKVPRLRATAVLPATYGYGHARWAAAEMNARDEAVVCSNEPEPSKGLTIADLDACVDMVRGLPPVVVYVVANPQYIGKLRRVLSPATGAISLFSRAGMLPLYEADDMPARAMVSAMSDGTMTVVATAGELTAEEVEQAIKAAEAVKAERFRCESISTGYQVE